MSLIFTKVKLLYAKVKYKCVQVIVPLANTAKGSLEEDPFLVVHPNYCYSDV